MISIKDFRGVVPRINPKNLGSADAQIARDVDIRHKDLRPYNDTLKHNRPSKSGTVNTIFRWADTANSDAAGQITAVSLANPCNITSVGHGRTTGERVHIADVGGTTEINNITHTITVVDADNYTLDGVDATSYTAYTSGGTWVYQNGYYLHWVSSEAPNGVDVARSQIDGKTDDRIYFTGDGAPKMTYSPLAVSGGGTDYPTDEYLLGVPAPLTAPSVSVTNKTGVISGATQASPVSITATAHGLTTGRSVTPSSVGGMTEINGNEYVITVVDANTFTLDGIDGSAFTAYTSGGTWTVSSYGDISSHSYVVTYVSALSEEGPPSPPTSVYDIYEGQEVDLSSILDAPAGDYNFTNKRIYRSVSGSSGARFYFVAEIAIATTTYTDDPKNDPIFEAIVTTTWDPPPSDMQGITNMPNGVSVGFSKNQLCFCIPYQPHAWPTDWRLSTEENITGIAVYGTTVVVGTETIPYTATGTHPSSVTLKKLNMEQACVSKRSMAVIGKAGTVFASPDGIIMVSGDGISNLTEIFFTRDEWQALDPYSVHCYYYDTRLVFFYNNGTDSGGYMIDFNDPLGQWMIELSVYATHCYVDKFNDKLLMLVGSDIVEFDGGFNSAAFTWKSRLTLLPRPKSLNVAQVIATDYTDTILKVYANGSLVKTKTVTDDKPFKFNPGGKKRNWEVEIESKGQIEQIAVVESASELAYL